MSDNHKHVSATFVAVVGMVRCEYTVVVSGENAVEGLPPLMKALIEACKQDNDLP
jgi:hypothetical protein